ncbi:MAG: helix-turn-helix transcriptional regulator [Steroidobacteraceae bacterium]
MKATETTARRNELREFLIARRAAVSPQSAGLSAGIRRRTPGLRREEVAALAGVGVTWYTWLEQGRDIRVSPQTLNRIADALRLSPTDTSYLFSLAGLPHERTLHRERNADVERALQVAVNAFRAPAFLVDYCWDVQAFNVLADRIYRFGEYSGRYAQNHIWRLFMDPARRAIYPDWESFAPFTVGIVRVAYGENRSDPYMDGLIQSLLENSAEFKRLWSAQHTELLIHRPVRLLAPGFGELRVTSLRFQSFGDDRTLILLPPANAQSERLLERMGSERKRRARRRVGRASAQR